MSQPEFTEPPVALTIAGSDCSAGAGIQADLKTFSAFGVYGLTALTCVVAEIPGKVTKIQAVDLPVLEDQIRLLLDAYPIRAIKTGMLWSAEAVNLVADIISGLPADRQAWLVIDPVMIASSGDPLITEEAITAYREHLLPLAHLITPNLYEAAFLTGRSISSPEEMRAAGRELAKTYDCAVLMKGGHLEGDIALDLLGASDEPEESAFTLEFKAPFIKGVSTHGTGCTYSAAIAAGLALGQPMDEAVAAAKQFITRSIRTSCRWDEIQALNHALDRHSSVQPI